MRLLLLFPLLAGVALAAGEQTLSPSPPIDHKVLLKLALDTPQREFHIGELIRIRLFFSSRTKNRYQLDTAGYDRSGRMNSEQFHVTPAKGNVDPIPLDALGMMGGGLRGFQFLEPKPWSIWLNLNEWVRFNEPGDYQLAVSSERVSVRDRRSAYGTSTVTAASNQIHIKVLPLDRAWQKHAFAQAVATLGPSPPEEVGTEGDPPTPVGIAWDTLRYLGTAEAAAELARRLRPDRQGNDEFTCYMGLVCSPARDAARDALHKELADPDHQIDSTFLQTLRMVESDHHPEQPYNPEEQKKRDQAERKVLNELVAVLPNKRGNAQLLSLYSAVEVAWDLKPPPQEIPDKLVSQLIARFDELPLHEQSLLLSYRWEKIRGPALLPIVKRFAQATEDSFQQRGADTWDSIDFVAKGIRHWFELEPIAARPFIIQEIIRANPRFGVGVLGILPDATLPEADEPLASHLAATGDYDGSSQLAALIARYGTPAILPLIVNELDAPIHKKPCQARYALLAYVLRVDPTKGRPLLERELAKPKESNCHENAFEKIAAIQYNPVLEEIAIRALDDPKLDGSAAAMLGKFGSAAAEAPLRRRYERWCEQWAGRESKLSVVSDDDFESDLLDQRSLGLTLLEALAQGQGWLTDQAGLRKLREMSKVPAVRQEADRYLERWDKRQPLTLSVWVDSFFVGHYLYNTIEPFEQKLTQFPSGTEFAIEPLDDSTANRQTVDRVREFVTNHGMSIKQIQAKP